MKLKKVPTNINRILMQGQSEPGLTQLKADKIVLQAARRSDAIVKSLNLSEISRESSMILEESSTEVVEQLREEIRQGSQLDAILVLETTDKQLLVIDGKSFIDAYELENVVEANAVIIAGDIEMAMRLRILAMAERLNNEQRRSAALFLLKQRGGWELADSVIGNRCGLAKWRIAELRAELIANDPLFANARIPYHPHVIRGNCILGNKRRPSPFKRTNRVKLPRPRIKGKRSVGSKVRNLVKKVGILRARQINEALRKFGLNATRGSVFVIWTPNMPYPHILFAGDCTDSGFYEIVFRDRKVGQLNADLPYNVNYIPGKMKRGSVNPDDKIRNDNLSRDAYKSFVTGVISALAPFLSKGAPYFVWSGQTEWGTVQEILENHLGRFRGIMVWKKKGLKQSRHYFKRSFEMALWGWTKGSRLRQWFGGNNSIDMIVEADLDDNERKRGVLLSWKYRLPRSIHPCPKPVGVIRRMIEVVLEPGGIVLDPVMGSGTTIIAAHISDRVGVGIELRPEYVGVAVDRFRTHFPDIQIERMQISELAAFLAWLENDYALRHP